MASTATIISLDAIRPLSRRNTIKSSLYEDKEAKLSLADRRELRILEDLLLSGQDPNVDHPSVLGSRLDRFFQGPQGCIALFFSPTNLKYVLSDFALNQGSSGGLPCYDGPNRSPPLRRTYGRAALQVPRRARGRLFAAALAVVIALPLAAWVSILRRGGFIHARKGRSASAKAMCSLTADVLAMNSLLRPGLVINRTELPRWSLLRLMTRGPEELQSRYARSILAGELLCRLGGELDLSPYVDNWLKDSCEYHSRSSARLLALPSLKRFILRHPRVSAGDWDTCERLLHTHFEDADDDRQSTDPRERTLARAAISWYLLRHVWRSAAALRALSISLDQSSSENTRMTGAIVHKFALVTEFVTLSYFVFDHSTNDEVSRDTFDIVPGEEQQWATSGAILYEFYRSTTLVIRQLASDGLSADAVASKPVSNRLSQLAREILSPVPN